jgi:glycerophosphoryl diester phosphodiesterase
MTRRLSLTCLVLLACMAAVADITVIAHRGASGYLPEHTLAAYAFAHAQGADYLEPDIVITRDGHAIALHDLYLDAVTDVREVFPGRARDDGRHYAVDFSLDEIRRLNVNERVDPKTGASRYPARFPQQIGRFQVPTLEEVIELTQGLNHSTGREVGIYPELKSAAFHAEHGHDMAAIVLAIVERYGYRTREDRCIVQSFEPRPLERLRRELGARLRLVQLLGDDAVHADMYTPEGLARVAGYADGIGPPLERVLTRDVSGSPQFTSLLAGARAHGLLVHPYTLRADALPEGWVTLEALIETLIDAGIDGVFIDHPDRAVAVRERRRAAAQDGR